MTEHACTDRNEFIKVLKEKGLETVILAWRKEWGPDEAGEMLYDHQNHCRLLAYHDGTIFSCQLEAADRNQLTRELEEAGFSVEQRSRNLTGFGENGRGLGQGR